MKTFSDSTAKRLLKKLINEAILTGNSGVHVRYYAMKEDDLNDDSPVKDIEMAISNYMFRIHANMNYQDIVDQVPSSSLLRAVWDEYNNFSYYIWPDEKG